MEMPGGGVSLGRAHFFNSETILLPAILKTDDLAKNFFSNGMKILQRFQQVVTLDFAGRADHFSP
jgi:hypothetical protein